MILKTSFSSNSLYTISRILSKTKICIKENFFLNNFYNFSIINRGGFGIVIKVVDKASDEYFAIKVIPFLIGKNNPDDLLSLSINDKLKEVRCLSNLTNENIIKYTSSWIESGNVLEQIIPLCGNYVNFLENPKHNIVNSILNNSIPNYNNEKLQIVNIFIQMELMDISLKTYLQNKKLNERNNYFIFREILNAVSYLHSKNMVHCDLKPENILINLGESGEIKELKIADFGLVMERNIECYKDIEGGTPLYTPPHKECISPKYDVYSLGIILYEMLNYFPTEMERIISISKLKTKTEVEKNLVNSMINTNSEDRPTLKFLINYFQKSC